MTDLAPHLGGFLLEHMPHQRNASRRTVESHADSLMLLVRHMAGQSGIRPSAIEVGQLTADMVCGFLDHLGTDRGNRTSTRNVRLGAIRSFVRYPGYRLPSFPGHARQINAIPMKRHDRTLVGHLDRGEVDALLDAPDTRTPAGLRDRAMLHPGYAAGLRVSELVGLTLQDPGRPGLDTVRVMGKGRRERVLPLWKETTRAVREWLRVRPEVGDPHLFLNARGGPMGRHGFAHRLRLHAGAAAAVAPSLAGKRVFPHILRHSSATGVLQATGDIRKVSLWLGHASIQSTEVHLRADPVARPGILAGNRPPAIARGTFRDAPDRLPAILQEARTR